MGKKKKLKQLRRLAAILPTTKVGERKVLQRLSGAEIIRRGLDKKIKNRTTVDPEKYYILEGNAEINKSHYRKLKKEINRNGIDGVLHYVSNLNFNQKQETNGL